MKTSRYSEPQILAILRQAEGGVPVAEHYMSDASLTSQALHIELESTWQPAPAGGSISACDEGRGLGKCVGERRGLGSGLGGRSSTR